MEKQEKPVKPYKSIRSRVIDGILLIDMEYTTSAAAISFAYGLHQALQDVAHRINVWYPKSTMTCLAMQFQSEFGNVTEILRSHGE